MDVKLDGQALGQVDKNGLDLPKLTPANHELELGAGKDLRKHSIEIGPERTLTAIIGSDPNTGTLLVQTNEDDVALAVLVNGKEVKHGNTKKGAFRSQFEGRQVSGAGGERRLRRRFRRASGGGSKGGRQDGNFPISTAGAGCAREGPLDTDGRFGAIRGWHFGRDPQGDTRVGGQPEAMGAHFQGGKRKAVPGERKTIEVAAGQIVDLDLRLTALPVPVEIRKNPPDSRVTYTRVGDPTVRTFSGRVRICPKAIIHSRPKQMATGSVSRASIYPGSPST